MSYQPLFIGGCDRSGTTMLGDLLGASHQSFATPESQWIHHLAPRLHIMALQDADAVAAALQSDFRFAVWNVDVTRQQLAEAIAGQPLSGMVQAILRLYVEQKRPDKLGATHWIDHTPDNFKYYPTLKAHFPSARFLHIVRDGRAVHQSIAGLNWGPNNAYMSSRFWFDRVELGLQVEMVEGDNCMRVRYEDLLQQPEVVLPRICAFAGLPYSEQVLAGGGLILPEFTRGQHQLVGRRPDVSRLQAWRDTMTPRQIAEFEAYGPTRELLTQLDYALVTAQPAPESMWRSLWAYLHDFALYLLHRRSHRKMEQNVVARDGGRRSVPPDRRT